MDEAESMSMDAEIARLDDAKRLVQKVLEQDPMADPSWYVSLLTAKELAYANALFTMNGDWKAAARMAGYGEHLSRMEIEQSDGMQALLKAVSSARAASSVLTREAMIARINRIALTAEKNGDFKSAMFANKELARLLRLDQPEETAHHVDGRGHRIKVVALTVEPGIAPAPMPEVTDEVRGILDLNGLDDLVPELPGGESDV
jgi:hypothetical protein